MNALQVMDRYLKEVIQVSTGNNYIFVESGWCVDEVSTCCLAVDDIGID